MRRSLPALPCLLVLSTLVFAACGSGSSEVSEVEEAIETAAASDDPADCTRLQTQKFTEQASHQGGAGAVKQCEEEAKEGVGIEAATVSKVKVNGSRATAQVAPRGGTLNGQTVEVTLVKSGDQWKLSEIVKFIRFDEQALIESLESEFEENATEVSAKFGHCFIKSFDEGGKQEVEELLLSPEAKEVEGVAKLCA